MRLKFIVILWFSLCVSAFGQSVQPEKGYYMLDYAWDYKDIHWSFSVGIPEELYDSYRDRTHYSSNFMPFVLSDYDRGYIQEIIKSFRKGGEEFGLSDLDNVFNVISFVQSLQYVSDSLSRGEEEYIRYPIETLVDGLGDCEDMVILAASILHEMGYSVLLVMFHNHLGMAIRYDKELQGTYYEYDGGKYYYLELTSPGWKLGQLPKEYKSTGAKLIPLERRPAVRLERCGYKYDSYYLIEKTVDLEISCEVENEGPGPTEGLSIQVVVKSDANSKWAFAKQTYAVQDLSEAEKATFTKRITVPRPAKGVVVIRLMGENFETDVFVLEGLDLK